MITTEHEIERHSARTGHCWAVLSIYAITTELVAGNNVSKKSILDDAGRYATRAQKSLNSLLNGEGQIREIGASLDMFCEFASTKFRELVESPHLKESSLISATDRKSFIDIFSTFTAARLKTLIANSKSIDQLIAQTCEPLKNVLHPRYPECLAFSIDSIKSYFFKIEQSTQTSGLFAIIREARNVRSAIPAYRNMLVRDLCWLTGSESRQIEGRPKADTRGYIFSYLDKKVYVIEGIVRGPDSEHVTLHGRWIANDRDHSTKKAENFQIEYVQQRGPVFPLQSRLALLIGHLQQPNRIGAWRTLFIRSCWESLNVEFALSAMRDRPYAALNFLAKERYIGVLYMNFSVYRDAMSKQKLESHLKWNSSWFDTRVAFQEVVASLQDSKRRGLGLPFEDERLLARNLEKSLSVLDPKDIASRN